MMEMPLSMFSFGSQMKTDGTLCRRYSRRNHQNQSRPRSKISQRLYRPCGLIEPKSLFIKSTAYCSTIKQTRFRMCPGARSPCTTAADRKCLQRTKREKPSSAWPRHGGSCKLLQPSLHLLSTVLLFPSLQRLVVTTLGLHHLSSFWILIHLELALPALATGARN